MNICWRSLPKRKQIWFLPICVHLFSPSSYQQSPSHHALLMLSLLSWALWYSKHLGAFARWSLRVPQLTVSVKIVDGTKLFGFIYNQGHNDLMLDYYCFSTHHFHTDPCNEQQLSLDLYPRCTIDRTGIPIFYKSNHYYFHKVSRCSVQIHFHFRKNMLLHLDHFNVTIHMMKIVIKYLEK